MGLGESQRLALEKNLKSVRHRTYLWLYLTFDDIAKRLELHNKDIAEIIRTVPQNVDEAYTAMLNKSPDPHRARKLLHIILASRRPMTIQEINTAIVVEECHTSFEDLDYWDLETAADRIKNICGLFATVVDSRVYLIHQTARDFLVGEQTNDWKMSFSPLESHLVVTKACICYLSLVFHDVEVNSHDVHDIIHYMFTEGADPTTIPQHMLDRKVEFLKYVNGTADDASIATIQERSYVAEKSTKNYLFPPYAAVSWSQHFTQSGKVVPTKLLGRVTDQICETNSRAFRLWWHMYCDYWTCSDARLGETPLTVASAMGLDAVVNRLLDQRAVHIERANDEGQTPLIHAAIGEHCGIVKALLDHGAQKNHQDRIGTSALSYAVQEGNEAVVELLLENGAQVNNLKGDLFRDTPIEYADTDSFTNIVKLLLDHGARNDGDGFMCTALLSAARGEHTATVELLLDYGLPVDSKDHSERTALFYAAEVGHIAVVELLLAHGAQVEAKDKYSYTPLFWAAGYSYKAVVELLLAHRAQVEARSKKG